MHPVKHFEEEPGRRSAAKLLAKVEARRIATNIAKLPQASAGAASAKFELHLNLKTAQIRSASQSHAF
jgi:hypothetical protein